MVNRGRSGACITCKKRRIKCDEGRPSCQRCMRHGLECGGYGTQFKFREQSHKFGPCARGKRVDIKSPKSKSGSGSPVENFPGTSSVTSSPVRSALVSPPVSLSTPNSAVAFYLHHYAGYGRSIQYARGFFEVLNPIYQSQKHDSPLTSAIEALASLVFSLWQHGRKGAIDCPNSRDMHARAVARLRKAIIDHEQVHKSATLLAVLALQLYENVVAIYNLRPAAHIHHDGALSLLSIAQAGRKISTVGAHVRKFVIHMEVSSAVRQNRSAQSTTKLSSPSIILLAEPYNPSIALDHIGISIADFQAACSEAQFQGLPGELDELEATAKSIDDRLLVWAERVPYYWQPIRLERGDGFHSSIPSYTNACDTYPSCQIANIWNLWRSQRLLLVKLMIGLITPGSPGNSSSSAEDGSPWESEALLYYGDIVQELIDSICRSIPFYLGNRIAPSSMADFTDSDILFPDCPPIATETGNDHGNHDRYQDLANPSEDHRRHVIAQGPWHIQSPLSRLLTLFSEEPALAEQLRPGQYLWIQSQFLRVLKLLQIVPPTFVSKDTLNADYLAKQVRTGAMFLSGP
jgi:hypothetical protein